MPHIDSLLEEALTEAYARGFAAGEQSAADKIKQALQKVTPKLLEAPPLDTHIRDLGFPERPRNCLARAQINTLGKLIEKSEKDLLGLTNFGQLSLENVNRVLSQWGMKLKQEQ